MKHRTIFAVFATFWLTPLLAQDTRIAKPPIPEKTDTPSEAEAQPSAPEKKVEAVEAKPAESAAPKEYVVQSGDNPWLIAKNHGVSLPALLELNDIKDAKNLKIGDVLKLPNGGESNIAKPVAKPVAEADKKSESQEEGDDWVLYTVEKGDNPWKIAKAMGVEHTKIMSLNKGLDFTKLNIGQQIKVPKKK